MEGGREKKKDEEEETEMEGEEEEEEEEEMARSFGSHFGPTSERPRETHR